LYSNKLNAENAVFLSKDFYLT